MFLCRRDRCDNGKGAYPRTRMCVHACLYVDELLFEENTADESVGQVRQIVEVAACVPSDELVCSAASTSGRRGSGKVFKHQDLATINGRAAKTNGLMNNTGAVVSFEKQGSKGQGGMRICTVWNLRNGTSGLNAERCRRRETRRSGDTKV